MEQVVEQNRLHHGIMDHRHYRSWVADSMHVAWRVMEATNIVQPKEMHCSHHQFIVRKDGVMCYILG